MHTKDAKNFVIRNNLASLNFKGTCHVILKNALNCCVANYDKPVRRYRTIFSFKQVHIYGFLLLTVLLPTSLSSPIPLRGKRSSSGKNIEEKPHWVNPCPGLNSQQKMDKRSTNDEENNGSDADFINSALLTAKLAIIQAEKFREEYVMKTFNLDLRTHHFQWKEMKYTWLRKNSNVPKELGEKVSFAHLESLNLNEEAASIYGYLQRLAVAFEQIIHDQRDKNSAFKEEFEEAEQHLKSLLCELREILTESQLSMFDDTKREIMAPEYRHMENQTHQHVRDWLIFRDYMNLVEYIIQVLEYFKNKTV